LKGTPLSSSEELKGTPLSILEELKGTPPSRERKIGKILSVELARDNERLSSKVRNFLIQCLIEVPFFAARKT
jgi:hypothetical protein